MNLVLAGKRILFLGIGFYDYDKIIIERLIRAGASVCYFNTAERTLCGRILEQLRMRWCADCYNDWLRYDRMKKLRSDNEIVFIIKGEHLNQRDIDLLKRNNPNARFVLYLWDSLVRHANKNLLLHNFDNIWSFDRVDCQNNPRLKFRPLFYREKADNPKTLDFSFIGWLHSDRLEIAREMRNYLKKRAKSYFIKLYTGRWNYFIGRYIFHKFEASDRELITLRPIPYDVFQNITSSSKVILDIAHPLQHGLTMRSIEVLANGGHLLTNNNDIINYEMIPPTSYTLFDRNKMDISAGEHVNVLSDYFSIDSFIETIFNA